MATAAQDLSDVKKWFKELLKSELKTFPKLGKKLEAPDDQGVYVIYCPEEVVLHVGRTLNGKKGLYQRLKNHMGGASSFTIQHLIEKGFQASKLRDDKYKFRFIPVPDPRERALLESYAIGNLCPVHIGIKNNK